MEYRHQDVRDFNTNQQERQIVFSSFTLALTTDKTPLVMNFGKALIQTKLQYDPHDLLLTLNEE
jgi:hypothetical protein